MAPPLNSAATREHHIRAALSHGAGLPMSRTLARVVHFSIGHQDYQVSFLGGHATEVRRLERIIWSRGQVPSDRIRTLIEWAEGVGAQKHG